MGWKRYDWQCQNCGAVKEILISVPYGEDAERRTISDCVACDSVTTFERLISLPAKYTGERRMGSVVHGGNLDTAGMKPLPEYPQLPDSAYRYEQRDMGGRHVNAKVADKHAMSDLLHSRQWDTVHAERQAIAKENEVKRRRLPHLRSGSVDLKSAPVKGDPNLREKRTNGRKVVVGK